MLKVLLIGLKEILFIGFKVLILEFVLEYILTSLLLSNIWKKIELGLNKKMFQTALLMFQTARG